MGGDVACVIAQWGRVIRYVSVTGGTEVPSRYTAKTFKMGHIATYSEWRRESLQTLLTVLAIILLVWTLMPLVRMKAPLGFMLLFPRATANALCRPLALISWAGALLAWWLGAGLAAYLFLAAGVLAFLVAMRILKTPADFAAAFGPDWETRLQAPERMLRTRGLGVMAQPPEARWQRDLPFATVPGSDRTLLCDLWQPPVGVQPSGLAYIYLHGSAWYVLDKDAYTRRFFRHLAAQGHVVMDVAYRLYPEAGVPEMVGDVKRAIAWLKEHAAEFGVNPDRIVIGGSSAGGHLSQLAGFAPDHPKLTPAELRGRDLSVRGIISCYGPSDLSACYLHTNQQKIPGVGATPPDMAMLTAPSPAIVTKLLGKDAGRMGYHKMAVAGRLDWLMGGTPEQVAERYALYSPVNHVHADCPPTLLLQGEDDLITSATATRELFAKLRAAGVPAVNVIYPYTDHMFDLMMLKWSPSAQEATRAIERFLALVA